MSYSLVPFIQAPSEKERKIIPEVYGEAIEGPSEEIETLAKVFNANNLKKGEKWKGAHTLAFDKYEIPGKPAPYKFIFDSTTSASKQVDQDGNFLENLQSELKNLQIKLIDKLKSGRGSENPKESQEEVNCLCEQIENKQL